ncbi:hydrogenase 4, membrane subunit [Candidatus Sulfotelmatobacter kueseliae]|uniref:Hydrogenase 4, membrane subunit n=1 Tax=Candidatus Sulfotelmatobacter kueseliae TaxID=2042962 RepID=A0A2U3L7N0_9BACT|nr:hydrogenase 4, membrane subunit [Candidatus Sulfotelmatobacter kueseliae]
MIASVAVLMLILPVAGALLSVALGRRTRLAALVTTAIAAALAIWLTVSTYGTSYTRMLWHIPWLRGIVDVPVFGFLVDPLASVMLLVAVPIGLLTVLFSTAYLTDKNAEHPVGGEDYGRYYFWLLLFIASMVGLAVSPNLLQFFIFWELTTLCSWALISFYQNERSLRAGFKAILMTHVGSGFFLLAILILFARTSSFEFSALGLLPSGLRSGVFILLLVAAWAKAAQVPLHTWLPDAMEAPTPISAYLHAAAMVKAGVYLMARTMSEGWGVSQKACLLMAGMALLTILVALSFYFVQDDLKRLLAYSTIAHLGYVLLGVAIGGLGSPLGLRGGVLHIICHAYSKATLFFCVGTIAYVTGTRSISSLRGLGRSMPLTATAFFIGVLSVTGVPPLACFWSKFMILSGAMRLPGPTGPLIVTLVLCETLISFGWMLYIAQKVFLGAPLTAVEVPADPPLAMNITLIVLMIGCVAAPFVGMPLVQLIGK